MTNLAFLCLLSLSLLAYAWNLAAARSIRSKGGVLQSIPFHHALYGFLIVVVPSILIAVLWLVIQPPLVDWTIEQDIRAQFAAGHFSDVPLILAEIKSIAAGQIFGSPEQWKIQLSDRLLARNHIGSVMMLACTGLLAAALLAHARIRVADNFRARQSVESIVSILMICCSVVAVVTTIGIVASLLFETMKFLRLVPLTEFLFGLNWEPQIPLREDQIAAAGAFGWLPVILGTLVITGVALFVSVPIGLMSAVYLNEYAPRIVRTTSKPVLEILAGVPTIVYGFFAILVIAPAIRDTGAMFGIDISPNTALAAGGVMGIMLIPFICSFADDALSSVPRSLHDGALALGATRSEAMLGVLFPAAIPGIAGGVLLAVSRAIGETMIVVMAAGLIAKLTINPLDSVTTVTVQIVTLLIGDTSFDNPKTLAAFALGMMLFILTLSINVLALRIVRKYREVYE